MPSRSISSPNFSGVHFIEIPPEIESAPVTQNIFSPTQKHRSAPHLMSSVAPGSERQNFRSCSMFIFLLLPLRLCVSAGNDLFPAKLQSSQRGQDKIDLIIDNVQSM